MSASVRELGIAVENNDYLKLEYSEGLNQIRAYIDARYKILQFIGFYNAAVLTFGFGQKVISVNSGSVSGIMLCALSILVAIMGITTENSLTNYNTIHYGLIRKIEAQLNSNSLEEVGVFTHGASEVRKHKLQTIFPVRLAHKIFYFSLAIFWAGFLVFQIVKFT